MVALDDKNDDYQSETVIRDSPFTSGFQIPVLMVKPAYLMIGACKSGLNHQSICYAGELSIHLSFPSVFFRIARSVERFDSPHAHTIGRCLPTCSQLFARANQL